VIIGFNDQQIDHMSDLPRIVGGTRPGTKATIEVWRKGKTVELKATVAELSDEDAAPVTQAPDEAAGTDMLGLRVGPSMSDDKQAGGVEVLASDGPAAQAGIEPGDLILRVNDVDITSPEQYARVIKGLNKSRPAVLLVQRGDQSQWVIVKPE